MTDELTRDQLTRDFYVYQRRRGHRTSVDDLLTAWYATQKVPSPPRTMLDLGTGIGSVALYLAWVFRDASLTAIEVQDVSFGLLEKNIAMNNVAARLIHGDLRELGAGEFDLVTGSPPYFDVKTGIVSADSQRAGARFELRGDVRDYCRAAKRNVAAAGRFVFCFPTAQRDRALAAARDAGLHVLSVRDVIPRSGLSPLFTLFACAHSGDETIVEEPFHVRDERGEHTDEMTAARAVFGMADQRRSA
jgi:tRNA1Val (adenine37-N6)-methyltransferase